MGVGIVCQNLTKDSITNVIATLRKLAGAE